MIFPMISFCFLHIFLYSSQRKTPHDYSNRWISFIHSFLVTVLSIYYLSYEERNNWIEAENKPEYNFILGITAGYTLYDTLFMILLSDQINFEFIYHHVIVFAVCFVSIVMNRSGGGLVMNAIISECTTPLLNIRYFFRYYSMDKTWMSLLNDMMFSFLFLYCRVYLSFLHGMEILLSENCISLIRYLVIPFYLLNLFWSYGICKLIARRLF